MSLALFGVFFFQAEDGIRDLVRSRGLGDVYKRQHQRRTDHHQRQPGGHRGDRNALSTVDEAQRVLVQGVQDELSLIHI